MADIKNDVDYLDEMRRLAQSEAGKKENEVQKLAEASFEQAQRIKESGSEIMQDFVSEKDMLKALSEQAGLPFVAISDYPPPAPEVLKMVPSATAQAYKVFPLEFKGDTLVVAISNPLNITITDDLRLLLDRDIEPVIATEEDIVDHIDLHYGIGDETIQGMVDELEGEGKTNFEKEVGVVDLTSLEEIANQAPVIQLVNLLLLQSIKDRASDIHIEPFGDTLRIRYRVDGMLREIPSPPKSMQIALSSRIKVMSGLDISVTRLPQDGRIKLTLEGREIDLRVATLPTVYGESIVMRVLDKSMMMKGVEQIGMDEEVLKQFMKAVRKPNGIVLVTGPTGCGKTTTLYAAINEINNPGEKFITTEDPVEYQLDGLIQVNVRQEVGLTFAACLKSILRQDPDIILVGEIRDLDTAQISIQASLTGHLVFSSLHTNSAAATVTRLIDMNVEPFLITSTLEAICGQRLVRLICPECKRPYVPTDEELFEFDKTREDIKDMIFFHGEGCDECDHTGYKGRLGLFELLIVSEEIKNLILDRATSDEIQEVAVRNGMQTLRDDAWNKICLGITTFEEAIHHVPKDYKRKKSGSKKIERMLDEVSKEEPVVIKETPVKETQKVASATPSTKINENLINDEMASRVNMSIEDSE